MNTRKQKIVNKISEHYSKSEKSAVIVCKAGNLNAKELKEFKRKIWPVGNAVFVKNTLFCQGVSSHVENYKNESGNSMNGSHFVVFGDEDKDVFQAMSAIQEGVKALKLQSKIIPNQVLLENHTYASDQLELFKSFHSKQALQGGICLLMKLIPIKICKVIQVKLEKENQ